jgi:hypothetical protein
MLCHFVGCGSSAKPPAPPETLVPLTGVVKVAGKPAPRTSVIFVPTGTTKGTGAFAVTDADGKYSVSHLSKQPGIAPGEYVFYLSRYVQANGEPLPEGKSPTDIASKQSIPAPWNTAGTSPKQKVTVPPEGTTVDIDVPKGRS